LSSPMPDLAAIAAVSLLEPQEPRALQR